MASPSETARRVLVTGLDGFTGRHVAAELAHAGYAVHGLSSPEANQEHVDLLDAEAVRAAVERIQPSAVIHLAAIAFVAHGDIDAIYRTNVIGTRHLLAALAHVERGAPPTEAAADSGLAEIDANAGQDRERLAKPEVTHLNLLVGTRRLE